MTCLACDEEFGPDDQCANCGAYEGETDVDRTIRRLEESAEALEAELDELKSAIRTADEKRCEVEFSADPGGVARALNNAIHDLAAKVN